MTTKIIYTVLWLLSTIQISSLCEISSPCNCYFDSPKYHYECPEITITVLPNSTADVICGDTNIDELLTAINIESFDKFNIKRLQIMECQLTQSFSNVLKKFNISNLEIVEYQYINRLASFSLSFDRFRGLEDITQLTLCNTDLFDKEVKLTSDTFKFLTELRYLKLLFELTTLPSGVFDNLRYLETLLLTSNNLARLNVDVLKNLQNLQSLDLSDNYFREIPADMFKKTVNLITINLNDNLLTTLPSNLFAHLAKLQYVFLMNCELTDLPEELFHGSGSLEKINLSQNTLSSLPEGMFRNLSSLEYLDLSGNRIRQIPATTFDDLSNLRSVSLADNRIDSLHKNQFWRLELVETIDLKNNNLTTLPTVLFEKTFNLKEIYLGNNRLKMSYTKFGLLLFNNNFNLEVIDLSHNNLMFFDTVYVFNKSKLKELDLSWNQIESISIYHFQSDSDEVVIDLRHNKISSIDFDKVNEVAKSRKATYEDQNIIVKLDDNPMHCDCFSYSFLKYLDETVGSQAANFLSIEADNLKCDSSNTSVQNVSLESVTCSFEKLALPKCSNTCNCFYRPWDGSVIADCENKGLTSVPEIIWPNNLKQLGINVTEIEINLKNNLLTFGPLETVGYENVTRLMLSSNKISEIKWMPPKLKVLELNNNSLSYFSEDMLAQIDSLTLDGITLGNNPWSCNCSTLHLYKFLLFNKNSKHIDISNITCERDRKSMVLLNPGDICSTTNIVYIASVVCVVAILIVICVLTIVYHFHENKIKVWLYTHNTCMWFVTEEELDKDKTYDAFISYSHVDEEFILKELKPYLECEPNPYKLCLHVRDWIPGKEIAKQIFESIEGSRRTLVILSPHFLESVWGKLEFRTAHTQAIKEGRVRVILVIYGDLNLESLDGELKDYVKTNTYIKWGDPWFWNKLKYALPHKK